MGTEAITPANGREAERREVLCGDMMLGAFPSCRGRRPAARVVPSCGARRPQGERMSTSRRTLLTRALGASAGLGLSSRLVAGGQAAAPAAPKKPAGKPIGDEGVGPGEDLMREHGVLNRILLVYDEAIRRVRGKEALPADAVHASADIIRRFLEGYHEKLEEEHLFPRFEAARKHVELVSVLRRQHEAGRRRDGRDSRGDLGQGRRRLCRGLRARRAPGPLRADVPAPRGPRGHRALPGVPRPRDEGRVRRARRAFESRETQVLGERGSRGSSTRSPRSSGGSASATSTRSPRRRDGGRPWVRRRGRAGLPEAGRPRLRRARGAHRAHGGRGRAAARLGRPANGSSTSSARRTSSPGRTRRRWRSTSATCARAGAVSSSPARASSCRRSRSSSRARGRTSGGALCRRRKASSTASSP